MCLDQSTLQIINVARLRGRQKPRRVFLLRAIEGLAVVTSYHPINLFQSRPEFEPHEGSYPCFPRPHHFVVLMLVNSRHLLESGKKRSARVHLAWSLQRPPLKSRLSRVPWLRTRRAPSIGAFYNTGALFAALRSVPRPVVLDVQFSHSPGTVDRAGDVPDFGRCVQTDQYLNPILGSSLRVFALVTRSLLSCGRWFLTHWRYPQSALDRWCLWLLGPSVVKPKLLDAGLSFVSLKPCSPPQPSSDS